MGVQTRSRAGVRSDINITPLIDVILVLLIIFLVTMPVMMQKITIEVPRQLDEPTEWAPAGETIVVSVQADGDIDFEASGSREQIALRDLAPRVANALAGRSGESVVFVDFDYAVRYDDVVRVMDVVASVGRPGETKIAIADKSSLAR